MTTSIEETKNVILHCVYCECPFYDHSEMYSSDKTFDFAVCKSSYDALEEQQWIEVFK